MISLFLCGSSKLSVRLFNGGVSALEFDWTRRGHRIWYPFVMKFRQLDRLRICASYERFFCKFSLSPNFHTLKDLELVLSSCTTPNGSCCLNSCETEPLSGPLNLSIATPNLTRLSLHSFAVSREFVALLPQSLLTLNIRILTSKPMLDSEVIRLLPRNLTNLVLYPTMDSDKATIAALPPNLLYATLQTTFNESTMHLFPKKAIEISGETDQIISCISQIPRYITTVSIQTFIAATADFHIPDHVHTLTMKDYQPQVYEIAGKFQPPLSLTRLSIRNARLFTASRIKDLPACLLHLSLENLGPDISSEIVPTLPKLKSLTLSRIESFRDDWALAGLPDSLVVLDLTPHHLWTNASFENLPRSHLRTVNLSKNTKIDNAGIALLPYTLTYLQLIVAKNVTGECFIDLPRGLTHFNLEEAQNVKNIEISHLPRALRYLRLGSANLLTNASFALLPRKLDVLILDGNGPKLNSSELHRLPRSLRQITLSSMETSNKIWEDYISIERDVLDTDEREDNETPILVPSSQNPTSNSYQISRIFTSEFWRNFGK